MIVLQAGKTEVWIDPTKITAFQRDTERDATHVYTVEGADAARVDETPEDIARLKAAWSNRPSFLDAMSDAEVIAIRLSSGSIIAIYGKTGMDTGE